MSPDEIRALPAGRELDRLVAAWVMGWEVRALSRPAAGADWFYQIPGYEPGHAYNPVPHYSTDIAAAWGALRQMQYHEPYVWQVFVGSVVGAQFWRMGAAHAAEVISREAAAAVAAGQAKKRGHDAQAEAQ